MADNNQALLLQVSADIRGLEKQFAKAQGIVDKSSKSMERRVQQTGTQLDRFFGQGTKGATEFTRALGNIKTASLQQLAPGADRYATALGHLGVAGVAAGLAIAGVAAAFRQARVAAAFADEIADTADRLHVTTDALQEFRFAIHAAGGESQDADEALENFSVTLGKAQQGLAKSQRAFLALGFTKEQIKGFADADDALRQVVGRIQGLSDVQQDAILQQLGLTGLKQLLDDGVTNMDRLRDAAHKAGVVMDKDVVQRGSELNDQIEEASAKVQVQLNQAFVDLGPAILVSIKLMGDLIEQAAKVVDLFNSIEHKRLATLKDNRQDFVDVLNDPIRRNIPGAAANARSHIERIDKEINRRELASINAALKRADSAPTGHLIDTSKTGGGGRSKSGPRDDTAQRLESLNQSLAGAIRDRLQAELQLTGDVEARAAIERQIAQQELAEALSRIAKQRADLADDKGFKGDRAAANAQLDLAEIEIRKAAEARQNLINREADWAAEDRADETRKAIRDAELQLLEAAAAQAVTAAERTRIEAQILKIKQQEALHEAAKQISRDEQSGKISDAEGAQRFKAVRDAQGAEVTLFNQDHLTAVQRYIASIQDLSTTMEEAGVNAARQLSDGLADAILGARSLGDVARSVFQQLASDILSATIQKSITGPIVSALAGSIVPAAATGGRVVGPGTGTSDSVPAMLSNGEFVVNAAAARRNRQWLEAINSGHAPHMKLGGLFKFGALGFLGDKTGFGGVLPSLRKHAFGGLAMPAFDALRKGNLGSTGAVGATLPEMHFHFSGTISSSDARRTGRQAAAAFMRETAGARKAGIGG